MTPERQTANILWGQVWFLAAIQGAITLVWVIYNLYLVQLLTQLGFPQGLAAGLLIVENLLAMVMEPLMGSFSDQRQQQVGTRFPLISLGVILSAGCFLLIPTGLLWGQGALRWLFPLLLISWALAMTVFRSPVLSLLGRYALRTQLPQAASILTLVGGVAGAMGPLANQVILGLGPFMAFAIGSAVLLLATTALGWVGPNATLTPPDLAVDQSTRKPLSPPMSPPMSPPIHWPSLAAVFGAGMGVTLGFRLAMTIFPAVLKQQVAGANPSLILGAIFIALAVAAIPGGLVATRWGYRRTMVVGLAIMTLLILAMVTVQSTLVGLGIAVMFGAALSLVSNGTLPFALAMVPAARAGLGTGMYFSGAALALSLWGLLMNFGSPTPFVGSLLGALAFLLAGVCVSLAGRGGQR